MYVLLANYARNFSFQTRDVDSSSELAIAPVLGTMVHFKYNGDYK